MEIKEGFVICTTLKKKKLLEEEKGFKNYIFLLSDISSSYPK